MKSPEDVLGIQFRVSAKGHAGPARTQADADKDAEEDRRIEATQRRIREERQAMKAARR